MAAKNNNALFYTCSLIEYIGREKKRIRRDVTECLGKSVIARIYEYADVFHCEPIQKVAYDFIDDMGITDGDYDNVSSCKYKIPDCWDIGEVYERLIEDCYSDEQVLEGIWEVYHSWIDAEISNYNTDFYYQSREYIAECYKEGDVL